MPTDAPTTRKVQLKRVPALKPGDIIVPARGLFTKAGKRLADAQTFMSGPFEVDHAELDSSGMFVVELSRAGLKTLLWAPADAWVVLA